MLPEGRQIYVYKQRVDMRKAIDGLSLLLINELSQSPQSGDIFIFLNKNRDKLKCLYWHHNGFMLLYKRLERGRFQFSKHIEANEIEISSQQLDALLMGFDFYALDRRSFPVVKDYY